MFPCAAAKWRGVWSFGPSLFTSAFLGKEKKREEERYFLVTFDICKMKNIRKGFWKVIKEKRFFVLILHMIKLHNTNVYIYTFLKDIQQSLHHYLIQHDVKVSTGCLWQWHLLIILHLCIVVITSDHALKRKEEMKCLKKMSVKLTRRSLVLEL